MDESDEAIIKDFEKRVEEGRELEGFKRVPGKVSKNLSVSFAIRLSPEEYEEFSQGAKRRGVTLADLMRSATRAALAGEIDAAKAAAVAEAGTKAREIVEAASRL